MPVGVSPHPDVLTLNGEPEMVRADYSALTPLYVGQPTLGWEGDPELCVYSWPRRSVFVLMRHHPGTANDYEFVRTIDSQNELSPADVNLLILWLVQHDRRRGFDPVADVEWRDAAKEAEAEQKLAEWSREEAAPRLAWALKRDLGQHMGGRRFDFHVPDAPWKNKNE